MEEYHRLDCLSAIKKVVYEKYPETLNVELEFVHYTEPQFKCHRYPGKLVFRWSDYFNVDNVPAELFEVQTRKAIFNTPVRYSKRVKEFFESSMFRENAIPDWLKYHGADEYVGRFHDYDVFTADQYEDFRISMMFKIILINKDARIEDSSSEIKRLSAQWDRQFNEMRNMAVCD